MKKLFIIFLSAVFAVTFSGYSQVYINGKQWKPKTKEEKEAEKKAKEEEKAMKKYSKSEMKTLLDMNSYPDYDTDNQKCRDVANFYYLNNKSDIERMNEYLVSDQQLDQIGEKYKDFWGARWQKCREDEQYKAQQMARKDDIEEWHKTARKNMDDFYNSISSKNSYNSAKNDLLYIKSELDKFHAAIKTNNNAYYPNFTGKLKDADYYLACISFLHGKDSKEENEISSLKKECEAGIESAEKERKNAIKLQEEKEKQEREEAIKRDNDMHAAEERAELEAEFEAAKTRACPLDKYAGSDKQTLKNIVIKDWKESENIPKEHKLMKVYITGKDWQRTAKYDYVDNSAVKRDFSTLEIKIIYQTNDPEEVEKKLGRILNGYLFKDHINGGRTELGNYYQFTDGGMILLSNSK